MTGRRAGVVRKEKGSLAGELGAVDDAGKAGVYMTSRTHPLLPFHAVISTCNSLSPNMMADDRKACR